MLESEPTKAKKKLLVISATYVAEENRKKLQELRKHFELTCVTTEIGEAFGLRSKVEEDRQAGYELLPRPAVGAALSTTRYMLRGLGRVFRQKKYDLIIVESEPWAWIRWQSWFLKRVFQPKASFGEFSWDNMERTGLKGLILALIYKAAVQTDDFVIAGSEEAGDLFRAHGLPESRLLIAPQLGVDEMLFHPAAPQVRERLREEMTLPKECFLVGYCGRFEDFKGVRGLVAAVEMARRARPDADVHLALAGAGTLRPWLEAKQKGAGWLHLVHPRPHGEVAEFMCTLDLFVLPSREIRGGGLCWKEQFGHVLIEAMACGVATVGSISGAIPEVLGQEEQLFAEGDVEALSRTILDMGADASRRARIGKQGRARVMERFANGALGNRWAAFLEAR